MRLTWAFDIHEERIWGLHKTLELVLLFLVFSGGVEEIDGESLRRTLAEERR